MFWNTAGESEVEEAIVVSTRSPVKQWPYKARVYVSKAFSKAQAGLALPRIVLHEARQSHATMLQRQAVQQRRRTG